VKASARTLGKYTLELKLDVNVSNIHVVGLGIGMWVYWISLVFILERDWLWRNGVSFRNGLDKSVGCNGFAFGIMLLPLLLSLLIIHHPLLLE
jgi:hypothetical protein